ncbi:MAG: tol-pal system-associated acyl-CoA thioesterase [Alphaproteobacteria bacterium]|nr:tol-pal system-associated acyl-CoA thioesterase [Alphaproteobacteria bacterium]
MTKPTEIPATPSPFVHRIQARVYYEDTDAGGIVYHANFLRFAERGRTEYLRALGFDHHQVRADHNLMLVVRHIEIDYRASGLLDDRLDIATEVVEYGNTSLTMKQVVSRGDTILAAMKVIVVAVSGIGKPVRIPPQLRQIFGSHKGLE